MPIPKQHNKLTFMGFGKIIDSFEVFARKII